MYKHPYPYIDYPYTFKYTKKIHYIYCVPKVHKVRWILFLQVGRWSKKRMKGLHGDGREGKKREWVFLCLMAMKKKALFMAKEGST